DPAPAVVNRPRGLQPARRNGYGGALNTEHLSEKFLCERKVVGADAILRHEEPARTALFHAMPLVARGALCHLIEYGLGVPQHDLLEGRAPRECAPERGHCQAPCPICYLGYGTRGGPVCPEKHAHPDHSFLADDGDLDARPLIHRREQRDHALLREIDMRDALARL